MSRHLATVAVAVIALFCGVIGSTIAWSSGGIALERPALAKADQVQLDTATLSYIVDQRMKRAMVELQSFAGSLEILERALVLAQAVKELPFELNLWQAQNIWYEIMRSPNGEVSALSKGDRARWDKSFNELGRCLSFDTEIIRVNKMVTTD